MELRKNNKIKVPEETFEGMDRTVTTLRDLIKSGQGDRELTRALDCLLIVMPRFLPESAYTHSDEMPPPRGAA